MKRPFEERLARWKETTKGEDHRRSMIQARQAARARAHKYKLRLRAERKARRDYIPSFDEVLARRSGHQRPGPAPQLRPFDLPPGGGF